MGVSLVQLEEHETIHLGIMNLSPTLGMKVT